MSAAAGSKPHLEPKPYTWDKNLSLPPETLELWKEVSDGIDMSKTVQLKKAAGSLDQAHKHLRSSKDAREFVDNYMFAVINILMNEYPSKIGVFEQGCLEESLILAIKIIRVDLEIQIQRNGKCKILNILAMTFDKAKHYYWGTQKDYGKNGKPEIRMKLIGRFGQEIGFKRLHRYVIDRSNSPLLPSSSESTAHIHHILSALIDSFPERNNTDEKLNEKSDATPNTWPECLSGNNHEYVTINVANAAVQFLNRCTNLALETSHQDDLAAVMPPDGLQILLVDLQEIFVRLIYSHRGSVCKFHSFWRDLTLKMITSKSEPLKLLGWQQVGDLLKASARDRPPPREFEVLSAGCTVVNGTYAFLGKVTLDGYAEHGVGSLGEGISYQRVVPETEQEVGGKKLTLFRCRMRSLQKWWFISEADKEQPGTDRDIDYYQHKSKEEEELPPPSGWVTCESAASDPPPSVKGRGLMVPRGEEFNTLEHQLAQWSIENGLVSLIFQDSTSDYAPQQQKTLIEFLVSMRGRDNGVRSVGSKAPNMFCLRDSHLLAAWDNYIRAVHLDTPTRSCRALVSILPSVPESLAISLLRAVQNSLFVRGSSVSIQMDEARDYPHMNKIEDFCLTLAVNVNCDSALYSDKVRSEALELLWSLLTHPQSASLKGVDRLEMFWSRLIAKDRSVDLEQPEQINGIEESRGKTPASINTGSKTPEAAKRQTSLLGSLPDELLLLAFQYLGRGHYAFVAGTNKRCRRIYRKATSYVYAGSEVAVTTTTIASIAESVSRSQFYIFQETLPMDLESDKNVIDKLTLRMRNKVGERVASVAEAAALSGNLPVLKHALKQPEGCSIVCEDQGICDNATKNGHIHALRHAISLGCDCNSNTCLLAAEHGQLEALQILIEERPLIGWRDDASICSAAASNGDLAMLKYARDNGCPWDRWTLINARANGHFEVARWAIANGCPDDDSDDDDSDDGEDDDGEEDDGDY